jgi:DNA-binding NarL/FixJ family response regulator
VHSSEFDVRVVVGEDETLLREGLVLLLTRAGFDVVAAVGDADTLITSALDHVPDVIVSDIRMPPTRRDAGLRGGLLLRKRLPGTGLLILSQHLSRQYAVELLSTRPGGVGYLWKQRIADADQFAVDVRAVGAGGTVLDPEIARAAIQRADQVHDGMATLTRRQRDVLELLARGLSNSAIAAKLFITEKSVVEHISNVYTSLDIPHTGDEHRRVLAVLRFFSGRSAVR